MIYNQFSGAEKSLFCRGCFPVGREEIYGVVGKRGASNDVVMSLLET